MKIGKARAKEGMDGCEGLTCRIENPRRTEARLSSRRALLLLIASISVLSAMMLPLAAGYSGINVDGDEEYGCAPCHNVKSSATIDMWASDMRPDPGAPVTVKVNLSGGEADLTPVGVLLISSLSADGSLPTDNGWTIVNDPSGTTAYNYYQIDAYNGVASLTWELLAPDTEGPYILYADILHGNGGTYYNENTDGLSFIVGGSGGTLKPTVLITSPVGGSTVHGSILLNVKVIPVVDTDEIAYVVIRINDEILYNASSGPYEWSIVTEDLEDGEQVINVTACDDTGRCGYAEAVITVDNASADTLRTNWIATMIAGVFAIAAIGSVIIVGSLLIRRRSAAGKVLLEKEGGK